MIIGLTGRIAAGKREVSRYFEKKGFEYYTVSYIIREVAKERNIPITRENLQDLGNDIRSKEGAGAWMKRLIKKLDLSKNNIIDGIRNPGEIEELRKVKDFYLISVGAPQKIRYQRVSKRAKPSDAQDWEGFLKMDERDFGEKDPLGQQVGKCMEMADYNLLNDSSIEDFKKKIEEIYNKIKC
jgi:dephospho-CoA kinase